MSNCKNGAAALAAGAVALAAPSLALAEENSDLGIGILIPHCLPGYLGGSCQVRLADDCRHARQASGDHQEQPRRG